MDVPVEIPEEYEAGIHIKHLRFLCHSGQRSERQGSEIFKGKQAIVKSLISPPRNNGKSEKSNKQTLLDFFLSATLS